MKNTLIKISKVIVIYGYGKAATLLMRLLVVGLLTVSDFGVYSLIIVWSQILSKVFSLGTYKLLIKELSASDQSVSGNTFKKQLVSWVLKRVSFVCFSAAILVFLLFQVLGSQSLGWLTPPMVYLFVVITILNTFFLIQEGILIGTNEGVKSKLAQHLYFPTMMIASLLVCRAFFQEVGLFRILVIWATSGGIALLIGFFYAKKAYFSNAIGKWDKQDIPGEWKKMSVSFLLLSFVQILFSRLDIVLIGFLGSKSQVAYYTIPATIIVAFSFIFMSFNSIIEPRFTYFWKQDKLDKFYPYLYRMNSIFIFLIVILVVLIQMFSNLILSVFGESYTAGSGVLSILSLSLVAQALSGPVVSVLSMSGYSNLVTRSLVFSLIFNSVTGIILIGEMGIEGVAIASLSSMILYRIQLLIIARKKLAYLPFRML